jgi:cell wall-associated NlpC family hydrolase
MMKRPPVPTSPSTNPPLPQSATPSTIGERAVQILSKRLGEHEMGRNTGKVVDWAVSPWTDASPDETGWAKWCAGAACTALMEAGSEDIKKVGSLSCKKLWRNCYEWGMVYMKPASSVVPQVGDLVFFGTTYPTHVGLLLSYDETSHTVVTIDGNSKDQVSTNTRQNFYGFARVEK